MLKRIVLLIVFVTLLSTPAFAVTTSLLGYRDADWGAGNSPGLTSARSTWAEVAEMENIGSDSRITSNHTSSYYYVFNGGSYPWQSVVWVWGGAGTSFQTAFTTPSDSLFVQFESDSNDGTADFYIDEVNVYSLDTYNGSWFAVIFSDLNWGPHTLRVVSTNGGDLAIDAMGSGAPASRVPEPTTLFLLGFGLAGLAGIRRKIK